MPRRTEVTYVANLDIPEEKIHEYQEAFNMFDKDKTGKISVKEIMKLMKNYGNPLTKEQVEDMIADIDTTGDGELDFEEFVTLMQKQEVDIDDDEEDAVLRAFKSFDKDKIGTITNAEFRYILTQLGERFSDAEVDTLFKECDLTDDGVLDYKEFIEYWRKL